jgi:hypothetical protein
MKFVIPLHPPSNKRGCRGSGKNKAAIQKQLAKSKAIAQQAQHQASVAASKKDIWECILGAARSGTYEVHICIQYDPALGPYEFTCSAHPVAPIDPSEFNS